MLCRRGASDLDFLQHLVNGLAEADEGRAEFIRSGEQMEEKVLRQLKRALKPAVTDLALHFSTSCAAALAVLHLLVSMDGCMPQYV